MAVRETRAQRKLRARRILRRLHKQYGDADCALHHASALELLVSTILSAQSTDETVNKTTPILFDRYPCADALATAEPADVERIIYSTGFYRQKTKSIIGAARRIVDEFACRVPDTMEGLTALPGVARKTANVVLGTWFGKSEGVVVDTHVGRVAERLALTWNQKNNKDARVIERDLMEAVPRKEWTFFGHALVWHGRRVCGARKADCVGCSLAKECPSASTGGR